MISFIYNEIKYKNIIIPVEDNFQYKNIKNRVLNVLDSNDDESTFKYQVVWELFFFQKIISKIEKLDLSLTNEIRKAVELCNKTL